MTKQPLLLISGHLCDERVFTELTPGLTKQAELFLASPPEEASIEEMAERLLSDAPDRFAVAGHSLGGMIAMAMMDLAPERLLGAALISTDPFAAREKEIAYRDDLLEAARLSDPAAYVDSFFAQFFIHKPSLAAQIGPDLRDMALEAAPSRLISEARSLSERLDRLDTLAEFDNPVIAIVGASDRVCPKMLSEKIVEASPNSELSIVPDAGHMLTLEAPDAVAAAMIDWLKLID